MRRERVSGVILVAAIIGCLAMSAHAADVARAKEARTIAKEAYIYGNPIVDG